MLVEILWILITMAVCWWLRSASDVEHTSINNTDFCEVGYYEGDKSKVYHEWAWNQWSSGNYVRATNYGGYFVVKKR